MNLFIITTTLRLVTFGTLAIFTSCTKYLDKKPNQKLTTPASLDDLVELFNDYDRMNGRYPSSGEASADNYYMSHDAWASTLELTQHLYLWQKYDIVGSDWITPYRAVYTANVVLDNIDKVKLVTVGDKNRSLQLKAMAYFIRAYNHFGLSQLFMPVYNKATATSDLGIPLNLTSDINAKITRSTSAQTYNQMISDIELSLNGLSGQPSPKYLPSKPAAYGLLSRVYFSMQDYKKAGLYADSCLNLYNSLIDYNGIDAMAAAPFDQFNSEDIYDTQASYPNALHQNKAKVDSLLYRSYDSNDIRKEAFFQENGDGTYFFKGNYTGKLNDPTMFTGIATDEMYLTRAECLARQGDSLSALKDLNTLLENRIINGSFSPYKLPIIGGLMKLILQERRKELVFRALRWTDLRRLNQERVYADTLYRILDGQQYELLPSSDRYTLQIDRKTIEISGIQQNP